MSDSTTFAGVMSAAMQRKQVTLSTLRDRLVDRGHPVSLASLSYWRSGRRLPERMSSMEALPELESMLGLDAGTLTRLVVGPLGRRVEPVVPFESLVDYDVVDPTDGSVAGEGDITRVSTHVTIDVGRRREIVRTRVRRLVVANRDGVEGFTVFLGADEDGDITRDVFRAVAGCSLGETLEPATNVRSTRVLFSRPLVLGESALTEIEIAQAEGADLQLENDYEVGAEQRLEDAQIWVRFDPTEIPSRCWVYLTEDGVLHEWPVDLAGAESVHHRQRDFGPGTIGVRWEW